MAEVLITLGIIGVVAALTIPSLITKINNKGYVEGLLKVYSTLQTVTNEISKDEGVKCKNWPWQGYPSKTGDNSLNNYILDAYIKRLKTLRVCTNAGDSFYHDTPCVLRHTKIRALNNGPASDLFSTSANGGNLWNTNAQVVLTDGSLICFRFKYQVGAVFWGEPDYLTFTVDVNGKKGPNKIGRDIFFLYLEHSTGKVLPFAAPTFDHVKADTCDTTKTGHSCAYRIITERKMNY